MRTLRIKSATFLIQNTYKGEGVGGDVVGRVGRVG